MEAHFGEHQRKSERSEKNAESPSNRAFPEEIIEAGDGPRTRDPQLGKLMLYQLSYSRL